MGSSIVIIWSCRSLFILSIIVASVVDLPHPVGPVMLNAPPSPVVMPEYPETRVLSVLPSGSLAFIVTKKLEEAWPSTSVKDVVIVPVSAPGF